MLQYWARLRPVMNVCTSRNGRLDLNTIFALHFLHFLLLQVPEAVMRRRARKIGRASCRERV